MGGFPPSSSISLLLKFTPCSKFCLLKQIPASGGSESVKAFLWLRQVVDEVAWGGHSRKIEKGTQGFLHG
jgi:hypothetical protein